jgi:CspA family cold shock protein
MQGIVKKVVRDRGFGFIKGEDGMEVFFHRTSLQNLNFDSLKEGEKIRFELEQGEKGARAVGVKGN